MSVAQVIHEIESMTPEERLQVQAFLVHLRRKTDPAHRAEMKARLDAMLAGRVATEADFPDFLRSIPTVGEIEFSRATDQPRKNQF
jgi:hypothetical protein